MLRYDRDDVVAMGMGDVCPSITEDSGAVA